MSKPRKPHVFAAFHWSKHMKKKQTKQRNALSMLAYLLITLWFYCCIQFENAYTACKRHGHGHGAFVTFEWVNKVKSNSICLTFSVFLLFTITSHSFWSVPFERITSHVIDTKRVPICCQKLHSSNNMKKCVFHWINRTFSYSTSNQAWQASTQKNKK